MSGIKGKDTKPELIIRHQLHRRGFRYRVHDKTLPGKPDLVMKKYNAVIFVHGCFWHKHNCHLFKWPKTRPDFWKDKINRNHKNDLQNIDKLINSNWRVCIVWECVIKGIKKDISGTIDAVSDWLAGKENILEVSS